MYVNGILKIVEIIAKRFDGAIVFYMY